MKQYQKSFVASRPCPDGDNHKR